jgi:hypothetical protein
MLGIIQLIKITKSLSQNFPIQGLNLSEGKNQDFLLCKLQGLIRYHRDFESGNVDKKNENMLEKQMV